MSKVTLLKEKLLQIHAFQLYTTLTPPQTVSTFQEVNHLINTQSSQLSEIEYYDLIELQFQLALIMGKDDIAKTLLDRINDKFGGWESERLAVLRIRYLTVTKGIEAAMDFIESRPNKKELKVLKAKFHLARLSGANEEDFVILLKGLLMFDPLDVETLTELTESYYKLGHFDKAIFTLEDVLMIQPYNHIVFARLGELYHASYLRGDGVTSSGKGKDANKENLELLKSSIQHFLRSVELCSNFVRGWSGLLVTTKALISKDNIDDKTSLKYRKLQDLAKKQLQLIVIDKDNTNQNVAFAEKVLAL
ncbi:hypothetical protein WICPIJ_001465 [Wickerhamomyces pijperi]|uniref:ER membrane protein complex subunit 2 n=1 Tax=Wickerhamomyces pijperi TaxID=599730 RepID=A0A9P8QDS2_WICPI|nr:hypothetical protein WICPIJ_001465 [Wickerhamomyces pijperi]